MEAISMLLTILGDAIIAAAIANIALTIVGLYLHHG